MPISEYFSCILRTLQGASTTEASSRKDDAKAISSPSNEDDDVELRSTMSCNKSRAMLRSGEEKEPVLKAFIVLPQVQASSSDSSTDFEGNDLVLKTADSVEMLKKGSSVVMPGSLSPTASSSSTRSRSSSSSLLMYFNRAMPYPFKRMGKKVQAPQRRIPQKAETSRELRPRCLDASPGTPPTQCLKMAARMALGDLVVSGNSALFDGSTGSSEASEGGHYDDDPSEPSARMPDPLEEEDGLFEPENGPEGRAIERQYSPGHSNRRGIFGNFRGSAPSSNNRASSCYSGECEFFAFCWLTGGLLSGGCGGFLFSCCVRLDGYVAEHTYNAEPARQSYGPVINDPMCGISEHQGAQRRVVGGEEAGFGMFPWQYVSEGLHVGVQNADRYDIAVLRLERELDYGPHLRPICLPEKSEDFLGEKGFVTGWGAMQADWHKSKGITVLIYDEMICAGWRNGGRDACQGDSGGPLNVHRDGRWYLVGLVSAGYSCAQNRQPGIYHRVAYTADWVSQVAN
ncbi:unnamed protein product [Cyprideis torosa]|uniref:Uncharacterized protein n=1 Tax=Cyprideis torosa TaxID=163714 RepID=A0A7R8ZJQ9_9CRUS|nr:unnamed protein product [Cyprideis torosa]CAG0880154.1 unnamed protein product [Cyprideis torosa]